MKKNIPQKFRSGRTCLINVGLTRASAPPQTAVERSAFSVTDPAVSTITLGDPTGCFAHASENSSLQMLWRKPCVCHHYNADGQKSNTEQKGSSDGIPFGKIGLMFKVSQDRNYTQVRTSVELCVQGWTVMNCSKRGRESCWCFSLKTASQFPHPAPQCYNPRDCNDRVCSKGPSVFTCSGPCPFTMVVLSFHM